MNCLLSRVVMVVGLVGAALVLPISSAAGAGIPRFTIHAGDAPAGYTIGLMVYPTDDANSLAFNDTTTGADIHCPLVIPYPYRQTLHVGTDRTILLNSPLLHFRWCTSSVGAQAAERSSGIDLRELSITSATATSSHGVDRLNAHMTFATADGATCSVDIAGGAKYTLSFQYSILRYLVQDRSQGYGFDVTKVVGSCAPAFALHDEVQFSGLLKLKAANPSYNPITVSNR